MQKFSLKLASSLVAVLAVITGCSSPTTVVNNVAPEKKVSGVEVSQVNTINLGERNGSTIDVNLKLLSSKPMFGIKAIAPGFTSSAGLPAGLSVVVKLHRYAVSGAPGTPKDRFDDGSAIFSHTINSAAASNSIRFSGLKPNQDYYISARAYAAPFTVSTPWTIDFGTAGAGATNFPINGTGIPALLNIQPGDVIQRSGGTDTYRVVSSAGDNITIAPGLTAADAAGLHQFTLKRNVTSFGNYANTDGKGQGADNNQIGGGTASAKGTDFGTVAPLEELIRIDSAGALSIVNDPFGSGGAIGRWDLNIQLMRDLGSTVTGNVGVNQGNALTGNTETIQ